MLSMATDRKPSATSWGVIGLPVACSICFVRSLNFSFTTSLSRGWSASGPKTLGKKSGSNLPNMTLQSVIVKGPPFR